MENKKAGGFVSMPYEGKKQEEPKKEAKKPEIKDSKKDEK